MQSQTCEKCSRPINLHEDYCGYCGSPTPTLIKDDLTIAPPSSKSLRSSTIQTSTSSAKIFQTRSATQPSKPTRNVQTVFRPKPSVAAKQKSNEKFWTMMTWTFDHKKFLMTTASIIGVLIIFGFIGYNIISSAIYAATPNALLQNYCNALKGSPDYDTAYAKLSSRETGKSSLSQELFITRVKAIADPHGGIGDCSVTIVSEFGAIAHGTIIYTYGDGSKLTERYDLFQDQLGNWFIDTHDWQPTTAPAA